MTIQSLQGLLSFDVGVIIHSDEKGDHTLFPKIARNR